MGMGIEGLSKSSAPTFLRLVSTGTNGVQALIGNITAFGIETKIL